MAFMDKLSEKLTMGANAVQNSTRKMTDTVRLNSEISMNTSEIDKHFKQIGMCVKNRLLPQINDPEVLQLAREIDELLAKNQTLSEQLNGIKGTRHCVSCGAELKPGAVFCQKCGTRNDNSQQQASMQGQPQQQFQQQPHTTVSVRPAANNVSPEQTARGAFAAGNPIPAPVPTPAQATEQPANDYSEFRPAPEANTENGFTAYQPEPTAESTPEPEQPAVQEEAVQQTEAPEQQPVQAAEQPLTSCPYCGCTKNLGKFCPSCGKKLK